VPTYLVPQRVLNFLIRAAHVPKKSAGFGMSTYTVRPAQPTDEPFLYSCYKRTMREYIEQTWGWDEGFKVRHFGSICRGSAFE